MSTAWNTFSALDRLFDDVMNDVMGSAFGTATNTKRFSPEYDVRVTENELLFAMDVPGVAQDDLEVVVESNILSVKGARKHRFDSNERVLFGRSYGTFEHSFALPEYVDVERLSAELRDGVLTIRLPKQPKAQPRRIAIGSASQAKQLTDASHDAPDHEKNR